jgi:HEAT repeat protein
MSANLTPAALVDARLSSSDAEVRWVAAFAASRAGVSDDRVVGIAVEALAFEDGDVRWAAAAIVTRAARDSDVLRTQLRSIVASGTPRSRKMALLCLCDSGVSDGHLYRSALADEDPFVRLAALTSLARSGDASPESLAALRAVIDGDADARVRRGATAILSRLSPQTA